MPQETWNPTIRLYHVREERLPSGSLIQPERWGKRVLQDGGKHPFFFREHILEIWRQVKTTIGVSRFNCAFAFEELEQANRWAAEEHGGFIHSVVPADPTAAQARLDMLWLTWMGEPNVSTVEVVRSCAAYWAGHCTKDANPNAYPAWEWLFACPLKVVP